jgi:tetratricopeptide (TPR) repeat protein
MNIMQALNVALADLKAGNLDKAEETYKKILRMQPDSVNALHFLGITYYRLQNYDSAIMYIKKALQLKPDYVDAYNNLGLVFQDKGQIEDAVSCFLKALRINPNFVQSYVNLGNTLQAKGSLDEAMVSFQKALQLDPNLFEVHVSLGSILHAKGSLDEAVACYQKAIQLNPQFYGIYNDLGIVLQEKLQFDEAALCFRRALRLNPRFIQSYINLGNTLQAKGSLDEAIACFQKVLQLDPDSAYANYNLSLSLLLSGNFEQGWEKYEWRRYIEGLSYLRVNFSQPFWDGNDMKGGTVLLLGEQGFGDIIQFIRYAPYVAQRNAKVVVTCHSELKSLVQNVDGIQRVIKYGEQLPEFDAYCPLLSLPFIFHTTIESIPVSIPYVRVNPYLVQKWKAELRYDHPDFKVGLVWSSNPKNTKLRYKSCLLSDFSQLAHFNNITFYSLQKGEAAVQVKNPSKGLNLIDLTEKINDFSDTAAFIKNLDLIISVDTAVAHLAGAIGKPVWILLPFSPDWRWMLNREDSPWYLTMRLFRQSTPGNWNTVIAHIEKELGILIKSTT